MNISRKTSLFVLIFFCTLSFNSICLKCQVNGSINPAILNSKWQAEWISYPDISLKDYGIFHFRKSFDLKNLPESFVIHVSGDNRYRLYVNGAEVCAGPARSDPNHWKFDTIDIAPYLIEGKNTLAAVVWNFAEYAPLAQMSNKTAFIVQGNTAKEMQINTNSSWLIFKNEAYVRPKKKPLRTVVGQGEVLHMALYPNGWEHPGYNDSHWLKPKLLGQGIPYGKFGDWEWMLVPNTIPFMEHKLQRLSSIRKAENITARPQFLKGQSPVYIPANQQVKILVDQAFLTTAYPELVVSGGKGATITLGYAEALEDGNGTKGNRNDITGKTVNSDYLDSFILDGGSDIHLKTLWFRTFRYMELSIKTKGEALVLNDLYAYFTAYPFQENASFKSSDQRLQKIWDTGWRTARLCAGETYFDCPYYEQLQYIGDTRIQSLISLYVSGDDRLMRNAISQFQQSMLPNGLTQSRYPAYQAQIIPPFSLYWIAMVHDYWMHRNDVNFVKQQFNGIRNVLSWYEVQVDQNGMLGPSDWWNFIDWSFQPWDNQHPLGGSPKGIQKGNSAILTLQYVYALRLAAELFDQNGFDDQAKIYIRQSELLLEKTKQLCWNIQKRLLADSPEQNSYSQHANIMAMLTGMFHATEEKQVMIKILHHKELTECTLYYKFYLFRAMDRAGFGDDYLLQLKPWQRMIDLGLTTFAETPEPTRSDCHAWSASPNYDFLALVCGIKPGSQGFKTVKITPHLGALNFVEGKVPHPNGDIIVSFKKRGKDGLYANISLPGQLTGTLTWKGKTVQLHAGKQIHVLQPDTDIN
ncbi:alpha-L-rhamnosidase-related protein [Pedobacter africanus]|uniref:Alpha-L-rhamnosidase n=1 Tax=Pedobacter africanus TaxID=151894 RepID=A0A1W1ZW49_9SPHI|nr:alpha-L-rhamnosidase C-terminal domain-containing protein [Pedobacter africanus]SMC52462.1 alpha-L-rhamnosidase [Pedobacter africanus]